MIAGSYAKRLCSHAARFFLQVVSAGVLCALSASAQTTTTYTYDALGRLVIAKKGSAAATEYSYDAADNRTKVRENLKPTAVPDYQSIIVTSQPYVGDFHVLLNDTDPNLPGDTLTITGLSGSGSSSMTTTGGGTILHWSGTALGTKNLTYFIADAGGLTSSTTLEIEFLWCPGGVCP